MSGPKVVRVVTREEIEAICRRQIHLFEEAAEELRRVAKRHEVYNEAFEADLQRRRADLQQLLLQGRLETLQRQAPQETAFVQAERGRVQAEAIAAREAARTKGRRLVDGARSLAAALEAAGQEVPAGARDIASGSTLTAGADLQHAQGVLNEAFGRLARPAPSGPTVAQQDLAQRLAAGISGLSFGEWLVASAAPANPKDGRLDQVLAELEVLVDTVEVNAFAERARHIAAEESPDRRALLTDSLVLDASEHIRLRRERERAEASLREARAALVALESPRARELAAKVTAALETKAASGWEELLWQSNELIETETRALAATKRRQAVLKGLAALGYEVGETMATAWARDGRIVVHKPGLEDYGVELGSPADVARLQVRLVGAANPVTPRDASRDRDQETIWCSDFEWLKAVLAGNDTTTVVERAVDAGAQAMKAVHFDRPKATERQDVQRPVTPKALRKE
ncbi:hypothetical protein [Microvirga sp. VF16]|uniref:hypothetical protein n=1 Tax=Microvirga sp. VF16 TaxID=2807101 RepID=UPI00193D8FF2|nr:hypothetical protein [Microvirga sp. VF16]QRM35459.1 hypothetical protein JO965_44795 [Microvirga sp. VF16]